MDGIAMGSVFTAPLLIFFIVAGFDTSKNILTLAMHELVQRPELLPALAARLC